MSLSNRFSKKLLLLLLLVPVIVVFSMLSWSAPDYKGEAKRSSAFYAEQRPADERDGMVHKSGRAISWNGDKGRIRDPYNSRV